FSSHGFATFNTPAAAARGFMQLVSYARAQEQLMQTPPAIPEELSPDSTGAASILHEALAAGRTMLLEPESKLILKSYGVPVVETQIVEGPVEACRTAEPWLREGHAVVVKILSDDITHKSDIRGVRLNLTRADQVETAAREILEAANRLR